MDELYRSLTSKWDKDEASKGLRYVVGYVRRERAKQLRVMSGNTDDTSEERRELLGEALLWKSGAYGKAWAANMRDRPRPQQLLAADAATHGDDQVYQRCAPCPFYYKFIFYIINNQFFKIKITIFKQKKYTYFVPSISYLVIQSRIK